MASVINANHPSSFPSAQAAIICDVCRKHVDMPTQCGNESIEQHKSSTEVQKHDDHFDCNICLDGCHDPVVTLCGHLFCWPCLYHWLSLHTACKQCPVCQSNVQGKIIPLYGSGKVDHSMNSAAMVFPDMHVPCRPNLPSRSDVPRATNTVPAHHSGEHNHTSIQDYEINTISAMQAGGSANVGCFASMLMRCCMASLSAYSGIFSGREQDRNIVAPRERSGNQKAFVLHWGFIFIASMTSIWLIVC